jgi:hypothetical protein
MLREKDMDKIHSLNGSQIERQERCAHVDDDLSHLSDDDLESQT